MHFRDRGRSVQLVRTTYDADTKKPKAEVVGRLDRPALSLSEEDRAKLTAEETAEVDAFVARVAGREAVDRNHAAAHFAETLSLVTAWLASADEAEVEAFQEEIRRPYGALRRELGKVTKKAG